MFIMSKRNLLLPSKDGSVRYPVRSGFVGDIPDWATQTEYFAALVKDGKVVVTDHSDKATQAAAEKPVKTRRKGAVKE